MIARILKWGKVKIISKLNIKATPPTIDYTSPFNNMIISNIINGSAIAASNASIQNKYLGEYWKIVNMENETLIQHKVYNKNWILGRKKSREATILLDMVVTINWKSKHIEHDRITIYNNNKLLIQGIRFPLRKEN